MKMDFGFLLSSIIDYNLSWMSTGSSSFLASKLTFPFRDKVNTYKKKENLFFVQLFKIQFLFCSTTLLLTDSGHRTNFNGMKFPIRSHFTFNTFKLTFSEELQRTKFFFYIYNYCTSCKSAKSLTRSII